MNHLQIAARLKLHNISQKELCQALKVHPTTMSQSLTGKLLFKEDLKQRIINYIKEKK